MVISDEWHRLEEEGLWVPVRAVPKERPQVVGKKGEHPRAYYSRRYMDFREAVAQAVTARAPGLRDLQRPISLEASFETDGFWLQLRPLLGWDGGRNVARPSHVRGDLDNLLGGVMDALQDGGILADDRWVMETHARCWEDDDE